MILHPFQISSLDVECSSTLERSDIGRWAVLISGAFVFTAGPDPISLEEDIPFAL